MWHARFCWEKATGRIRQRGPTRTCEDIGDLREIGWGGMEWINLARNREEWRALVSMVTNLRVL
jgi:hypothetical protein